MEIQASEGPSSTRRESYVDDMEGESDEEIPLKEMSFGSGSKEAESDLPGDSYNQHILVAEEGKENYPIAQPLFSHRCHLGQTSNFSRTSTVTHAAHAKYITEGVPLLLSCREAAKEICAYQEEISYSKLGREIEHSTTHSPRGMKSLKVMPSTYVVNSRKFKAVVHPSRVLVPDQQDRVKGETPDVPMQVNLSDHSERELPKNAMSIENQIYHQYHSWTTQESTDEGSNSNQTITVAVPGSSRRDPTRTKMASREHRAKVAEGLKALRELLPGSVKGTREAITDGIIDYIKYLQLEVKVLSQSRLGGEPSCDPFIHFEGFGHYLFHDMMLHKPLEEAIGELMETNMLAVTQLLESKGLSVMPMSLAEGLSKSW